MQTFLPFADFRECARVLDRQRLGKQRVETLQIMKTLTTDGGWRNHPAVRMWRGHEFVLMQYQIMICDEWVNGRGYKDTCREKTEALVNAAAMKWTLLEDEIRGMEPDWLGDEVLHLSHRSRLLQKAPEHYAPLFPKDTPRDLEYMWPVA